MTMFVAVEQDEGDRDDALGRVAFLILLPGRLIRGTLSAIRERVRGLVRS